MSLRDLFVVAIVLGSVPFILTRPYIGIIMWTWLGFMNPHRLAWGMARELPLAQIVALATLASLLISREPKTLPKTRESLVLFVFILWMCVSTFFSEFPELAVLQLEKVLKIQLMVFVTMMLMASRKKLNLLIWTIALSVGFYGVKGGIFTFLTGGGYHVLGPPGTFIGGNNEIGLALIMTIPLMRYLQLQARNPLIRHGLTAAMILTGLSILGTQSRGALVGVAAMVTFLWSKGRRKIVVAVVLALCIPVFISFMPQSWHTRMHTIEAYETDGSAQTRLRAWEFAYRTAQASPLVGGGFEIFRGRIADAHSIYFEVLGEHGFVGLGLFLLLLFLTWRTGSSLIRLGKKDPDFRWLFDLASMVQVSMVGYCAPGAFLGLAYFDYFYTLIAVMILGKTIAINEILQRQQLSTSPAMGEGQTHKLSQPNSTKILPAPQNGSPLKP